MASTPTNGQGVQRAHRPAVASTRIGAAWTAVAVAVVLGILLIVFIAQNTRSVRIRFFTASGSVPVAVALLASAVVGALVVLVIGIARTTQLRHAARQRQVISTAGAGEPAAATGSVSEQPASGARGQGRGADDTRSELGET